MLARRAIQAIVVLIAGTLGFLTRDLLWLVLGGLVLVYYELWIQTRLLGYLLQEQRTTYTRQAETPEQSIEETAEPTEITPVTGPGYELVEPEYVTSRQQNLLTSNAPEKND